MRNKNSNGRLMNFSGDVNRSKKNSGGIAMVRKICTIMVSLFFVFSSISLSGGFDNNANFRNPQERRNWGQPLTGSKIDE
jgi:hypothetical protein